VFLDEIGDVPASMQPKLLRVLQEREVRRVGESHSRPVDVRVISATNHDLEARVAEGRFREDLFFRLHVVHLHIPPLRERREDILPLARHFLKSFAERLKLPELRLAPDCVDILTGYPWPGNVRELENTLEHAAVMCTDGTITSGSLPLSNAGRVAERHGITAARSLRSASTRTTW
jgi:transcriptional regulator with PAS, ATPase and Fis domain